VLHQIGVGALGPVFRTYEPIRDRLVAVKVFRLDVTPEQAQALADELGRTSEGRLFHPSIVEPLAAGLEGTVAYRAEEYVAAESLDVALRHYAPATMDKVLPFITQLASAVDFARGAGVGHGGLHPRDIFVTPDEARATGFGVVDALDRLSLRAPVRRPYSPPERIAGEPWRTPADVFSLGVIAFELLTGRRPSGVGDQMGPLTGATLEGYADAVRAVLARAMDEDPSKRYPTAMDFASELDRVAAGAPVAKPAPVAVPEDAVSEEEARVISNKGPLAAGGADDGERTNAAAPEPVIAKEADEAVPQVAEPAASASDFTLEDFGSEPAPSFGDSPREVARKAIAARKRQNKPRIRHVEPEPFGDLKLAGENEIDKEKEGERSLPVASSETDAVNIDADLPVTAAAQSASVIPESASPISESASASDRVIEPPALSKDPESDRLALEPTVTVLFDEAIPAPPAMQAHDLIDVDTKPLAADATPIEDADATIVRDMHDRVVAVDEFRAREANTIRHERTWPRQADRVVIERPARPPRPVEPIEPEPDPVAVPLDTIEEPSSSRRFVMLPHAVMLIVGLLLGYGARYFEESRTRAARPAEQAVADTRPAGPSQTPGTTGTAAGTAFSEQAVAAAPPPARPPVAAKTPAEAPARTSASAKVASAKTRAARSGKIVIESTPAGAAVTVNGKWSGRTPLTLDEQPFRSYVVRLVQPGFEVARQTFSLSPASATRTISVKLKPSASVPKPVGTTAPAAQAKPQAEARSGKTGTGEIYVDSRPRGARVLVDGKEYGVTPLRVPSQTAGTHVVVLELADHTPWTNTAKVTAGETARVTGSLERIR
jgi:serine/threonine-protein kinase